MIFEGLSDKLQGALGKLKSKGKLTEKDVKDAMREVKLALLEADVNFKVVKDFIKKVQERCVGQEVMESLTPAQHVIKIVNEELTSLMGDVQSKVMISSKPPTIIMMVGLQGAGKTTTSGKIGNYFKKQGKRPLLVACDVYRPAAIKQLQVVGEKLDIPVFNMGDKESPVNIAKAGLSHAIKNNNDLVIIDTAGRLHIDEELMDELKSIPKTSPFVCVSRTGAPYAPDSYPQALKRLIHGINKQRNGTAIPPMPEATYHDLRHTHAAMLIKLGTQPKIIQERLGHASIKITMDTYGYLMTGLQEAVADALDTQHRVGTGGHKSGHTQKQGYDE